MPGYGVKFDYPVEVVAVPRFIDKSDDTLYRDTAYGIRAGKFVVDRRGEQLGRVDEVRLYEPFVVQRLEALAKAYVLMRDALQEQWEHEIANLDKLED